MMNDGLTLFENKDVNASVRMTLVNGEPWFVAGDICKFLELSNTTVALDRLDEDEKSKLNLGLPGGDTNIVNEYGLYMLVLASRKPQAKEFKRWITHDVIPSIRKHGMYAKEDLLENLDLLIEMAQELKGEREQRKALEARSSILSNENALLAQRNLEWADASLINALVRAYGHKIGDYQKAWGDFKKELLYQHGININSRRSHHLNNGGKKSKKLLSFLNDDELPQAVGTAVALCLNNGIDISELIEKASENETVDGGDE